MSARFSRAIVRLPADSFSAGLSSARLGPADFGLMQVQHEAYVRALRDAGLEVEVLEPAPRYPDAHFVEDVAVVVAEVAVIARPAPVSRRGEQALIEPVLATHRRLARIEAPGTLEGGDVLQIGERVFIGITARTNRAGALQLEAVLSGYGYRCIQIPVDHGLHLKSEVNLVAPGTLVATGALAARPELAGFERIVVDPAERYAANVLRLNDRLLVPRGFPRVTERLRATGIEVVELDVSEARKMDGGLTCLSLRL